MHLEISVPSIVLLVGVSGAGKSTFARRFFSPTEILSSDRFRALVADDENDQSATGNAFSVLRLIARMRLQRGKLCVVDATNVKRRDRRTYVKLANQFRCPVSAIVLDPGLETCLERRAIRPDRIIPEEAVRRQYDDLMKNARKLESEGFAPVWRLGQCLAIPDLRISRVAAAPLSRLIQGPPPDRAPDTRLISPDSTGSGGVDR